MKYLQLLVLILIVAACSENTSDKPTKNTTEKTVDDKSITEKQATEIEKPEELTEVKGHTFTEYYPGKKKIKFQGIQDDEKRRHGKWSYYNLDGLELSTTMYEHGKKHGHMIVKHENGAIYYHGEMSEDKKVGIWKNYDSDGVLIGERDFGEGE